MKYRLKETNVEAIQWTGNNYEEVINFFPKNAEKEGHIKFDICQQKDGTIKTNIIIYDLGAYTTVKQGDYIVNDDDYYFSMQEKLFHEKYEKVEE